MTLTSVNQARPFVAASAPKAAKPAAAEQQQVAGDSVSIGQQPQAPANAAAQAAGQQPAPSPAIMKDWTVLVYSVSDNNLYRFMQADLDEAERVGSTPEMNVLAETSHQPKGGNVARYELITDNTPGLKSPVLQDLGRTHDMAKSANMADSIAWAMEKYPSKHFFLIASDHGAGWKGAHHAESTDSWMNATDLEDALKTAQERTGRKIDVLGFDQCLMASTEIAHQLAPYADILVASEEVEGGAGWQYDAVLPGGKTTNTNSRILSPKVLNYAAAALRARDPLTPEDMAKAVVTMAEGNQRDLGTMSAVDLRKMPALSEAINNFAGAVIESDKTKADFAPIAAKTQKFYDFADMGHFVSLAGDQFGGKIGEAAAEVKAALSDAVIAEQHSTKYANATGLNIEINRQRLAGDFDVPNMEQESQDRMSFDPYSKTKFAKETLWDEMLQKVR
jgi:hypothetical protein